MEKAGLGLVPENEIIQVNSKAKLERGRDKNKGRRGGVGKEAGRRRPWNKRSACTGQEERDCWTWSWHMEGFQAQVKGSGFMIYSWDLASQSEPHSTELGESLRGTKKTGAPEITSFFFFFWPWPWHVEGPRPGIKSYNSSDQSHSRDNARSLTN